MDGAAQRADDEGALIMAGSDTRMAALRARVLRLVGDNALTMARQVQGLTADGERQAPAKHWWNLPAKVAKGMSIAAEEEARRPGRNNASDAMRHAEWSRRMTEEIGPAFSMAVGGVNEAVGLALGHPLAESVMDMRNNAEGIEAGQQHRAVDGRRLQDRPMSVTAAYARSKQNYEDTTPDRVTYGLAPGPYGEPGGQPRYEPEAKYPPYR